MGCLMGQRGSLAGVAVSSCWLARAAPEPSGTKHMTRRAFSGKAMLKAMLGGEAHENSIRDVLDVEIRL